MAGVQASGNGQREALRFGPFEADLREWALRRHGRLVRLQGQPFQILAQLLAHPGELVTREQLRHELWPDHTFVDFDRGLNKAINKLRTALRDDAGQPRYIETVPRHGYRLIAAVEVAPAPRPAAAPAPAIGAAPAPGAQPLAWPPAAGPSALPPEARGEAPRPEGMVLRQGTAAPPAGPMLRLAGPHGRGRVGWIAAALAVALTGAGWLAADRGHLLRRMPAPAPRLAVAVLGFRNLSGQRRAQWLATALSDWLTTELAAGHQLRLVPQQGVARMRAELHLPVGESLTAGSLERVRLDCGADLAVTGAYALLGGTASGPIRLDVVVQDTRTGATLLALHQSGRAADLLALVARAGTRLRAGLGVEPVTATQAAEVRRALPANPTAARDYAEGMARLRIFDAVGARQWLQRAVAADPDNALAHSALAAAWRILGYDQRARAEAREALRLAAGLGRRQSLLIEARNDELARQWRPAIGIFRALCQFFPDNLNYALALAHARTRAGQGQQALAGLQALRGAWARTHTGPARQDPRLALAEDSAEESLGDYAQMLAAARRAAAEARASGASLLLARALADEAWADENLGAISGGVAAARRAQRRYAADGDANGVAATLTLEAIGASDLGRSRQALAIFQRALRVYERTGREDSIAAEWNNIGSTEDDLGQPLAAAAHFRRARAIYRQVQHADGVALTTANLGMARLAQGQTARAQRDFAAALAICQQVGDRSKAALAEMGLAKAASRQGQWPQAQAQARRALAAYRAIGDRRNVARLQLWLARSAMHRQQFAAASPLVAAAQAEFHREGLIPGQVMAAAEQARLEWRRGDHAAARQSLAQAQALAAGDHHALEAFYVARTAAWLEAAGGGAAGRALARTQLAALAAQAKRMGLVWEARRTQQVMAGLGARDPLAVALAGAPIAR